jgi:hypothetical protein
MLPLIDVAREAVLRSGCRQVTEARAGRGGKLGLQVLAERLLLVLHAYGTGAGIRGWNGSAAGTPAGRAPRTRTC